MFELFNEHAKDLAVIGAALVTIASAMANIFPKKTFIGKIVHFIAINFKVDK